MLIWKYDEGNQNTHLSMIEVPDNHVLGSDELKEIPTGFLTPAKLVNGVLTSASEEESNQAAQDYLKKNGIKIDNSVSAQQQIALLSTQIATQAQAQNKANALLLSEIAQLKAQIQGTTNKEA
ncbi:hypothetical protein [Ligilactobacillus aviarius]|uniref:hypothetical protein n=1 Tax=Ligilactobacillus aviarius TaxID=1606 RepID=UPI00249DA8BB|nr:hypothetical protein [Ligilactobacillus aviarius]